MQDLLFLSFPEIFSENTFSPSLPESSDAGQGYIDGLTFLCDSPAIGLRDYALLSGGTATTQVWGSAAGNIPDVQVSHVGMLNVVDILKYTSFIVTKDALERIEEMYNDQYIEEPETEENE